MRRSSLQSLAGFIWIGVGLMLTCIGIFKYLLKAHDLEASGMGLGLAIGLGLLVGIVKGRFVLSKSALRNKDRIAKLEEPLKPWNVFTPPFFLLIVLMMGMGLCIRTFLLDQSNVLHLLCYGGGLFGIGGALFVSAFAYWFDSAFRKTKKLKQIELTQSND